MANGKKYVFSEKNRWIATAIAIILLAIAVAAACTEGFTNANPWGWFGDGEKQEEELPEEDGGLLLPEASTGNGISLMSMRIPVERYAEYDISPLADSAATLTATITPANATNKAVDWTVAYVDGSTAAVTEVEVVPAEDGALTATLTVNQAFSKQIKVVCTSRANDSIKAKCVLDYAKRITAVDLLDKAGSTKKISLTEAGSTFTESAYTEYGFWNAVGANWDSTWKTALTLGVGTVEDTFVYSVQMTWSQDWINALKAQGFNPIVTAGTPVPLNVSLGDRFGAEAIDVNGAVPYDQWNNYVAAINAMAGKAFFTVEITATGTYSTFTGTCACSAPASLFEIKVTGIGLNDTHLTF